MAKNFLALDMLPHWADNESADDKCRDLLDYLYKMREGLAYVLGHLDSRNFSESSEIAKSVQDRQKLMTLIQVQDGTVLIGGEGAVIEIVGTVKINGQEWRGTNESSDV